MIVNTKLLKQKRKEYELTQKELGSIVGCRQSVISTLENNQQLHIDLPGLVLGLKIASVFDIPADDLFTLEDYIKESIYNDLLKIQGGKK